MFSLTFKILPFFYSCSQIRSASENVSSKLLFVYVLCFWSYNLCDLKVYNFCLWEIHSYLIVTLLYIETPTNPSQIISISFRLLFLHQTIKYFFLRYLTSVSFLVSFLFSHSSRHDWFCKHAACNSFYGQEAVELYPQIIPLFIFMVSGVSFQYMPEHVT